MIKRNVTYHINEEKRTYCFPNSKSLVIDRPRTLLVTSSGNHYIETDDKKKFIVTDMWSYIAIESNEAWVTDETQS